MVDGGTQWKNISIQSPSIQTNAFVGFGSLWLTIMNIYSKTSFKAFLFFLFFNFVA
jgi:hypothetical protein